MDKNQLSSNKKLKHDDYEKRAANLPKNPHLDISDQNTMTGQNISP